MLSDECKILTWDDLVQARMGRCTGSNVYGFGGFKYRVKFGGREEIRECHDYIGAYMPGLLTQCVVVIIRIEDFDQISCGVTNPVEFLNEFELKIYNALVAQSSVKTMGYIHTLMRNEVPEQYVVGLVVPITVLDQLPGGVLRLPYYGLNVGTYDCVFPDTQEIIVSNKLRRMLNADAIDKNSIGDVYGTWYFVTSEIDNVWWMYDSIRGAMPLRTTRLEGTRQELIRYSRWFDHHTGKDKFTITVVEIESLSHMSEKERTTAFCSVGLFRTENEALASNEAHKGLLDHQLKYAQVEKITGDLKSNTRKLEIDEEIRRKEWEYKEQETASKLKDRPVQYASSLVGVLKNVVDVVVRFVGGITAMFKLYSAIKS